MTDRFERIIGDIFPPFTFFAAITWLYLLQVSKWSFIVLLFYVVPTVMTFLSRYIGASTATSKEAQIIFTIWTESLPVYDLLQYKASVIASSIIWLGRYSQIIRGGKEKTPSNVNNIEKNIVVNRIGVVGKDEIKVGKTVKCDVKVNIVEDIISDKDHLLEQLSVRTNGYPWTSTLTNITGIYFYCQYLLIFREIFL